MFLCDILNSSCNAQYFHTSEHIYSRLTFVVTLVDNEFSSKYCCVGLTTMTNSILSLLIRIERELQYVFTAPAKEFKALINSISRVIRVMIDNRRILFSEVWDGVEHRVNIKVQEGRSTK